MIQADSMQKERRVRFSNGKDIAFCDMETGFTPHDLLEAALATCLNLTIRKYAREHAIRNIDVSVAVRVNRDEADQAVYECTIKLNGSMTDEQRDNLMNAAQDCAVRKTLSCNVLFEELDSSVMNIEPIAAACPLSGCG